MLRVVRFKNIEFCSLGVYSSFLLVEVGRLVTRSFLSLLVMPGATSSFLLLVRHLATCVLARSDACTLLFFRKMDATFLREPGTVPLNGAAGGNYDAA